MGTGNVRRFRRDKEGKGLGQDKEITKKGKGQEHGGRIRILEVWWSSD